MASTETAVRGEVLRQCRKKAGLSPGDLAFQVRSRFPIAGKVSDSHIRQYERGVLGKTRPNLLLLAAISEVLDCSLDDLAPGLSEEKVQVMDLLSRIT